MNRRRWSDPDELLDEWTRLSALTSPRQPVRAAVRGALLSPLAGVAALAIFAVGLAALAGVALQLGGMASRPADVRVVELPTYRPLNGYPTALLEATLEKDSDCVYAAEPFSGTRYLVIWPPGTTLHEYNSSEAAVIDGQGRVIASIGEAVRLGGGEYAGHQLDFVRTLLATDIAAECVSGRYWLAATAQSAWGDAGPATWRVDPARPPMAGATSVAVLLTESACASGRSPAGRVLPPEVDYRADRIVISLSVRSWPGDCPSNPEYRLVVELNEPVGDRLLADGHGGGIRWPIALPTTQPTTTTTVAPATPSPTPIANEWDDWQFWLGDYHPLIEALRELSWHFPAPAAGEPPAAMTLASPLFDGTDRATLRQLDEEIAASGGDRFSERVPGFWLGDLEGAVAAFGGGVLVEDGDALWLVMEEPEWHARRLRGLDTPAGNEVWVLDDTLVAHHDCLMLEVPPFRTDGVDVMDSNTSGEEGFADVYIFGEGDSHVQVTVRHDDPACMAHPVMGPILDHLLSDD